MNNLQCPKGKDLSTSRMTTGNMFLQYFCDVPDEILQSILTKIVVFVECTVGLLSELLSL